MTFHSVLQQNHVGYNEEMLKYSNTPLKKGMPSFDSRFPLVAHHHKSYSARAINS